MGILCKYLLNHKRSSHHTVFKSLEPLRIFTQVNQFGIERMKTIFVIALRHAPCGQMYRVLANPASGQLSSAEYNMQTITHEKSV